MKYKSTRGDVTNRTFEEALYTGYAEDGGILLPETIPKIDVKVLKSWTNLSYVQLAKKIIPLYVSEDEIPSPMLNDLLDSAFSRFSAPEITPIKRLPGGLNVMELFHGPTWAFKDLALSCVGKFLQYFLSKRKKHLNILVGTSGDTGSAAIESVRGQPWIDIVVLLPRGRCSQIQELQMTTVLDNNVHVYRVDGTSDDLDIPIKLCFQDHAFTKRHNLSSINSINWARIMVQTVHYIYAYLQMCPSCDDVVQIVVPTGACGNVTSGIIARKMGVPLEFVCAVTQNDVVARTVKTGDYRIADHVIPTLAPAMDIQIPYNMERIWYVVSGGDCASIKKLMKEFEETGSVTVPEEISDAVRKVIVDTFVASDDVVRKTMKSTWDTYEYLLCPHTAVGVGYHYYQMQRNPEDKKIRVVIATASVIKFEEALQSASIPYTRDPRVAQLFESKQKYKDLNKGEDWLQMLRDKIEEIDKNRV
ncbi:threonine synthase-like 2 [Saccostrea echinata]|uniref:threonine synthase-like 2 n=1 Tax=Saccostrea echinata TaxID=191078 RepID=UPI002A7FDF7D|nr:threonine synthase-like 2 [Saccostrea echinata]